ncbi:MAG: hypothetical protein EZS28_033708, partial [Streblomastix strix]
METDKYLPEVTVDVLVIGGCSAGNYFAVLVLLDIKCDNILLQSPLGSNRVFIKMSDFGFAKKEDKISEQTYLAGTIPYITPELFKKPRIATQKSDMYSIGITFYRIITHSYPVNKNTFDDQKKKIATMSCIERPSELQDDIQWDLLSKLLEFDPDKRITAAQAIQHPYFTSSEAIADISQEQYDLAQQAAMLQSKQGINITKYDTNPMYIVSESVLKQFIIEYSMLHPPLEQTENESEPENEAGQINYGQEGFLSVFEEKQNESNNHITSSIALQALSFLAE